MANDQESGRNWAVAVVHGVGESKPIEMLRLVTSAVTAERKDLELDRHVHVHFRDEDLRAPQSSAAASATTEAKAGEAAIDPLTAEALRPHERCGWIGKDKARSVRVAAAHWSDISMFGEGILRLIGNLALGGLGVRYFADVAASGTNIIAKTLHGLLTLKIWLLALGFLPIVLCTLVFSLHTFIGYYIFRNETFELQAWAIALLSALTIWWLARIARRMLAHMKDERSLAMPIFIALRLYGYSMAALILLDHPRTLVKLVTGREESLGIAAILRQIMVWYGDVSGNLNWLDRIALIDETGVYIAFLQLLQYLCGYGVICLTAFVLVTLLIACVPWFCTGQQRRGMLLAAVGVTTIWLLMLFVLWPENLITGTVLNLYLRNDPNPALSAVWTFYWQFAWPPVGIQPTTVESVNKLRELMPLLWFDVFFLIFLIGVTLIACFIVRKRSKWSRSHKGASDGSLDKFPADASKASLWAPRLILAGSYQTAVVLFMLVIAGTATAHTFKLDKWLANKLTVLWWIGDLPHELFMGLANVTLIVIAIVSLFLLGAHRIQKAIKLALDVVNHFAAPGKDFPIRTRIRQRLVDTLNFLLKPNDNPHLVVICHSQGTVITLDTLLGYRKYEYTGRWPFKRRKTKWVEGLWENKLRHEVSSLTILTFGSPITHLYQHYFSTLYPSLDTYPSLQNIGADLESGRIKWYNCYRIDDYIGTHIDPIKDAARGDFPINIPMGIGGHTDYWKEDVFKRLFARPGMEQVLAAPASRPEDR